MDSDDKPYFTRVWPYLLAGAVLCVVSISLGRYCSVKHEPGYRVSAISREIGRVAGSSPFVSVELI